MGSDRGGRGKHRMGAEKVDTTARDTLSLVFRRVQGYTVQGIAEMVCANGSDTGIFASLPSFIHRICGEVQPNTFKPSTADVGRRA